MTPDAEVANHRGQGWTFGPVGRLDGLGCYVHLVHPAVGGGPELHLFWHAVDQAAGVVRVATYNGRCGVHRIPGEKHSSTRTVQLSTDWQGTDVREPSKLGFLGEHTSCLTGLYLRS
eukprot:9480538-Pyramimonas_sp.AAC.1